jgi:uncharacterized RDD family membrane protein YckC
MASLPGSTASATAAVVAPQPGSAAATESGVAYVGLITRAISFALDAVVINLVATVVGIATALILSLLHLPGDVKTILGVIGAVAYVLWLLGYFVVFWSTTGQTPGARVMQLRVQTARGETIEPRWALVRFGGLLLAALPLFAGFVPVLFDARRRAFQDRIAGTVVVEAPALSMAATRRGIQRAEYLAARQAGVAASGVGGGAVAGSEPGAGSRGATAESPSVAR